jgi:alpha-glucosidase
MLQKAAEHKLHIQFHGAYKPTGMHRTYPNEFTREGTLNYEGNKWGSSITPDHDINIPFTRMLAGSTDYHLGGFRAAPKNKFKVQYTRPLMMGTRCHQLAMYVVLENYLGMVCDYPDAYTGQPGFEFLKEVPTVWDETKVLGAKVGEWISIARRKGNDWFVGTITNGKPREVTVSLDFLDKAQYSAETYADKGENEDPNHLEKKSVPVDRSGQLIISMASGGGHAMHIKKLF